MPITGILSVFIVLYILPEPAGGSIFNGASVLTLLQPTESGQSGVFRKGVLYVFQYRRFHKKTHDIIDTNWQKIAQNDILTQYLARQMIEMTQKSLTAHLCCILGARC